MIYSLSHPKINFFCRNTAHHLSYCSTLQVPPPNLYATSRIGWGGVPTGYYNSLDGELCYGKKSLSWDVIMNISYFLQVTGNPQPSSQVVLSSGFHIVDQTPNPLNGIDEMIVILQNKRNKIVVPGTLKTLKNVLPGSVNGIKKRAT